jgi:hypothetical protein
LCILHRPYVHLCSNDALKEFGAKESLFLRIRRQRMGIEDFETIKVIGRGAFGEVRLCRSVSVSLHADLSLPLFP